MLTTFAEIVFPGLSNEKLSATVATNHLRQRIKAIPIAQHAKRSALDVVAGFLLLIG